MPAAGSYLAALFGMGHAPLANPEITRYLPLDVLLAMAVGIVSSTPLRIWRPRWKWLLPLAPVAEFRNARGGVCDRRCGCIRGNVPSVHIFSVLAMTATPGKFWTSAAAAGLFFAALWTPLIGTFFGAGNFRSDEENRILAPPPPRRDGERTGCSSGRHSQALFRTIILAFVAR